MLAVKTAGTTESPTVLKPSSPKENTEPFDNKGLGNDFARAHQSKLHAAQPNNPLFNFFTSAAAHKPFGHLVNFLNSISVVSLFGSSILNLGFHTSPNSPLLSAFNKFTDFANKGSQVFNSLKNIFKLTPNRDYTNALGHFFDLVIPLFAPMEDFYLLRGLPLGVYTGAHAANVMNEKNSFSSLEDHLTHIKTAAKKTWANVNSSFLVNLLDNKKALMGIVASLFSLAGFALFKPLEKIMGPSGRKLASLLRDIGGVSQAFEGMKLGHLASGRIFWSLSAYFQFAGAAANLLGETVLHKFKKAMDPLSFAFSGLNRWLFRISNERGESAFHNKGFSYPNIKKSVDMAMDYLSKGHKPKPKFSYQNAA